MQQYGKRKEEIKGETKGTIWFPRNLTTWVRFEGRRPLHHWNCLIYSLLASSKLNLISTLILLEHRVGYIQASFLFPCISGKSPLTSFWFWSICHVYPSAYLCAFLLNIVSKGVEVFVHHGYADFSYITEKVLLCASYVFVSWLLLISLIVTGLVANVSLLSLFGQNVCTMKKLVF